MVQNEQKISEKESILRDNPNVDRTLVTNAAKLEAELRLLGVDTKPKYRITPALDSMGLRISFPHLYAGN